VPRTTRVIAHGDPVSLGVSDAPLTFHRPERARRSGEGPGLRRLRLDGEDAFDLSFWCGTCPLVFERLEGSNRTLSSTDLQERLNSGVSSIDEELQAAVSALMSTGTYVPLLLSVFPKLVSPGSKGDYFTHEQVAHRGIDGFWGLPHHPKTPYYRGGSWQIDEHELLFEFIVPMVPPRWNNAVRVAEYEIQLRAGRTPTVLAMSIVDHTQPFDSFDSHSGLMHFILDGHHKLEAAARARMPITLMSFLSIEDSLEHPQRVRDIARLIESRPKILR
jgi:hypothetical protein